MIELDSLKFTVQTDDLVRATGEIKKLQAAVSALNAPMQQSAKASAAAAKAEAQLALAAEKVAQAKAKTELAETKVNAAKEKAAVITQKLTRATTEETSVLERQQSIFDFMIQGYSKGQASTLAYAKSQGVLADELKQVGEVLKNQRKLLGGEPFDKSASGLTSMRNALVELKDELRTNTAGIEMTSKQYKEFARDKLRIIEVSKAEGESLSQLNARLREHGAEYVQLVQKVNSLTAAEKERERAARESANAMRALQREDEKTESILKTLNSATEDNISTSDRAAIRIANYERYLRQAGITGEQAAAKLLKYKSAVQLADQADQQRRMKFLSNALAPQISDVVVSLAGGMNPLTVMLQQGLQVRDLIGQSNVDADRLQETFRNAASNMVSTITGMFSAMSSLVVGTIRDAGAGLFSFAGNITGTNKLLDKMKEKLIELNVLGPRMMSFFEGSANAAKYFAGVGLFLVITAVAAAIAVYVSFIKEQSALTKAITLTGAALGQSQDSVNALAKEYTQLGIATGDTVSFFTALAQAGVRAPANLEKITKAANDLRKVAGVSFEETTKQLSALADKPTESLIKYAIASGRVTEEELKRVIALEKAGKEVEAITLAQELWAASTIESSRDIYDALEPVEKLWFNIKEQIGLAWDEFKEFSKGEAIAKGLRTVWELFAVTIAEVWYVMKMTGKEIGGIAAQIAAVLSGNFAGAVSIGEEMKKDAASARAEQDALINRIMGVKSANDQQAESTKRSTKEFKANSDAARNLQEQLKKNSSGTRSRTGITEADRLKALMGDLGDQGGGFLKDFTEKWNLLGTATTKYGYSLAEVNNAYAELLKQQPIVKKQLEDTAASYAVSSIERVNDLLEDQVAAKVELTKAEQLLLDIKSSPKWALMNARDQLEIEQLLQMAQLDELAIKQAKEKLDLKEELIAPDNYAELKDSLTDAIVSGLTEGGKSGSKKLRDILVAELSKPITIFVRAIVDTLVGSLAGGSQGGNIMSTLSSASSLSSAFTAISGGISTLGSTTIANTAGALGGDAIGTLASLQGGGSSAMASIGSAANMMGGALVGFMAGKMISGGYSAIGKSGNTAVAVGTAIGAVVGGPIGAAIGGTLGGAFNRLFGRKLKDSGIQGSFGGEQGFAGENFQFLKGGLFRSNKTNTSALDPAMQKFFADSYSGITASSKSMASVLGLSTEALNNFSMQIKLSTKGLSEDDINKKINETFAAIGEAQAKLLLGAYAPNMGETALEALTRLSSSLAVVNTAMKNLGGTLYSVSIAGGDMASKLTDLFGGIENYSKEIDGYYQAFYSEQERMQNATSTLTQALQAVGLALPNTNAEFRSLVDAQDLTTDSGRATYRVLVGLSGAFNEVTTYADKMAETLRELTSSLIDEVKRLRGEIIGSTSVSSLAALQGQFAVSTAAARAGDTNALQSLPELSKAIEDAAKLQATSASDIARIQAWLINSLSATAGALGTEVPAFASGGLHMGGARIVGEGGPELEVTGPSRIYSASQTAGMLGGSNKELIYEVQMLRAEVRADVAHNAKTAKLLDRVIPDGDAIQTTGGIDGGVI